MVDPSPEHVVPTELLQTKLYRPMIRPALVSRSRLRLRLDAGLQAGSMFARKLTLVAAPAGFGKTTLVATWIDRLATSTPDAPVCGWLSLDATDNDPPRFLGYLLAALQPAAPSLGGLRQTILTSGTAPELEAALLSAINVISEGGMLTVLVLDDVHHLHSSGVASLMTFLVDHQPANLHLVIATRTDPPLPLARLRARGQMLELRAQDLRFTESEAAEFLTRTMGLELQPEWIAALEQRTEGWIAGLQLAALSLYGHDDPAAFVGALTGSHRYIIDYLVDEVLTHQPPALRDFLVQTSILDRLCAPLCAAVLPSISPPEAQAVLEKLDRSNLFLMPLDDQRRWYRYHHLFADSLRVSLDSAERATLHRRAARWFEAQGHPDEAVAHALASGDLPFATDRVEHAIRDPATWSGGRLTTLVSWLDALPDATLDERPVISLHVSRALYLSGRILESERLLIRAIKAFEGGEADDTGDLAALADIYRGAIAVIRGQVQDAIRWVNRGVSRLPENALHTRARAYDVLGTAYRYAGDVRQAEAHFLQAAALAQQAGVAYLAINARCEAAQMQIAQGHLQEAVQTCRDALQLSPTPIPPQGLAWAILGEIARQQNDLVTAERHLEQALALAQQGGLTDDVVTTLAYRAWLRHNQGDVAGAQHDASQIARTLQAYGIERLSRAVAAQLARFDLMQGRLDAATAWARGYEETRTTPEIDYRHDTEDLVLARVLLATGRPQRARVILNAVGDQAQAGGRLRRTIEVRLLTAIALHDETEMEEAAGVLREAIIPAAAERWLRLLLDEAETDVTFADALAALLPRVRDAAPAFVDELLSILGLRETPASPSREGSGATATLLEPPTDRELEILGLLAEGMTNREIGQALYIAVGTVKWYLHHLYEKLEVSNRTQAVARARELGLL